MLVKNQPKYEDPKEVSKPTKSGIRVIDVMPTTRILLFVAHRHRVGLLTFNSLVLDGYIVYDKVVRLFV